MNQNDRDPETPPKAAEPEAFAPVDAVTRWASSAWLRIKDALWTVAILLLVLWAAKQIPIEDPKAGVDIFGALAMGLPPLAFAMAAHIGAVAATSGVFTQFRDPDERKLWRDAVAGSWQAVALLVIDRGPYLLLWVYIFTACTGVQ